jgi:hypothetical protein
MPPSPLSRLFTAKHGGFPVAVALDLSRTGTVRGRLDGFGGTYDLHGLGALPNVQGTLVDAASGHRLSFTAEVHEHSLLLLLFPLNAEGWMDFEAVQTLTLYPEEVAAGHPAPTPPSDLPSATAPGLPIESASKESAPTAERAVSINGHRLSTERLRHLEAPLQVAFLDGRYWYDATSGAWGAEGGPPAGFLAPDLDLPGPTPPEASGGGTGLFANGREMHPQEVRALGRHFGAAPPGRYWLDALGNFGIEGGPFLLNLLDALAPERTVAVGDPTLRPAVHPAAAVPAASRRPAAYPVWTTPFE